MFWGIIWRIVAVLWLELWNHVHRGPLTSPLQHHSKRSQQKMCKRVTHKAATTKVTQSTVFLAERANCWKTGRHILVQPLKQLFPLQWTNLIPEGMIIIHGWQGQTGIKKSNKTRSHLRIDTEPRKRQILWAHPAEGGDDNYICPLWLQLWASVLLKGRR